MSRGQHAVLDPTDRPRVCRRSDAGDDAQYEGDAETHIVRMRSVEKPSQDGYALTNLHFPATFALRPETFAPVAPYRKANGLLFPLERTVCCAVYALQ